MISATLKRSKEWDRKPMEVEDIDLHFLPQYEWDFQFWWNFITKKGCFCSHPAENSADNFSQIHPRHYFFKNLLHQGRDTSVIYKFICYNGLKPGRMLVKIMSVLPVPQDSNFQHQDSHHIL